MPRMVSKHPAQLLERSIRETRPLRFTILTGSVPWEGGTASTSSHLIALAAHIRTDASISIVHSLEQGATLLD